MFTTTSPDTSTMSYILDAWDSAAQDARLAWNTWLASAPRDRGDAYASYRASLDREEQAATVLATAATESELRAHLEGVGPDPRSD